MNIRETIRLRSIFFLISMLILFFNGGNALAATANENLVQKSYIAYYARSGDPGGADYWRQRLDDNGGDIEGIINEFGNSAEYVDRFSSLSNTQLVSNIYQNLFNRAPDDAGLQYYVGLLETNQSTLARISLDILNGSINDDLTIVNNKLEIAHYYTDASRTRITYTDPIIIAILAAIDKTTNSVDLAKIEIDGLEDGETTTAPRVLINVEDAFAGPVWSDVTLKFSGAAVKEIGGAANLSQTVLAADEANKELELELSNLSGRDDVIVTASALGYLDTGASVVVSPDDAQHEIHLRMVKNAPGSAADGIYTATMDITPYLDGNGTTTQVIDLESKADSSSPGVSISIPAGTQLTDKNGDPITDGTLSVTSFDPYKPRALAAFPGGFNVKANANGFVDGDGNGYTGEADIDFKTAGFAAISIESDSGQKVKNFSQDVSIGMEVKQGTTDPKGTPVGNGTAIPVWSYDEDIGEWGFESQSAAIGGMTGGFGRISFATQHLSYWNLDWHYGPKCAPRFNFLFSNGNFDTTHYKFKLIVGSNPAINRWMTSYQNDGFLQLNNVPANASGALEIYDATGQILLHTEQVSNFCDASNNNTGMVFDIIDIPPPDLVDTNIELSFACPAGVNIPGYNSDTVPFDALLATTNGNPGNLILGSDGSIVTPLVENQSYSYVAVPNTSSQQTLYSALADPSSAYLTITGSLNSSDNTHQLMLSEAFCTNSLSGGTINGTDTNNIGEAVCNTPGDIDGIFDTVNNRNRPSDVVRAANGDLYFSEVDPVSGESWIKKWPAGSNDFNHIITVINHGTTDYPDHFSLKAASSVKTRGARGLDLQQTPEGEVLYYADMTANCVNALFLSTSEVITVAGQCGSGGNRPIADQAEIDVESRLNYPVDVAIDATGHILYLTDHVNRKVRMVTSPLGVGMAASLKNKGISGTTFDNRVLTIAGTGSAATADYVDGANALNTNIGAGWLDVASDNTVVFTGSNLVSRIYDITSPGAASTQLLSPKLQHVAGIFNNGVGVPSANINQFNSPGDIEIDTSNNILVADRGNHRVKRIDTSNNVTPAAGNGSHTWYPVCGDAIQERVSLPIGIWIEHNGGNHGGTPYDFVFTENGNASNWIRQVRY